MLKLGEEEIGWSRSHCVRDGILPTFQTAPP